MHELISILSAWSMISIPLIMIYLEIIRKKSLFDKSGSIYIGDFIFGILCLPLTLCFLLYKICRVELEQRQM